MGYVTADVIADSASPFRESLLVNVGKRDEIQDGAAVIDGSGIVGRVVSLGENSARILLLTDLNSHISVSVQPSGRRGILSGNVSTSPDLKFLASTSNIAVGDRVVTTGDDEVLPPDLTVGRIKSIDKHSATVVLASNYEKLDFVRIIRYTPNLRVPSNSNLVGRCPDCMSGISPHP
jgi:rod shape-determining protein MreC